MKKSKLIILCLTSILLIGGCGTSSNTIEKDLTDNVKVEENKIKLDKDNAITISYSSDDYNSVYDLFSKQQIEAQKEYIDKTVKITGEVTRIENDRNGNIVISITSDKFSHIADIYIEDNKDNEERTSKLKVWGKDTKTNEKGDLIAVYGIFEEFEKQTNGNYVFKIIDCEWA